jgi:dolichyl-phosphate beta-glucosyltransferase
MMAPDLVLIVPCYNEAGRLREAAFLEFARQRPSVHVLFVDDGSVDGTAALHGRLAATAPASISVLRLETNRGKAEAVRRGILEAMDRGPALVGYWDADLSTPLAAVDDFMNVAAKHPDIDLILGSRVLLMGRDIRRKATRHYLGRVFATAASLALSLPVYDTQCGAKVFRANGATRRLFATPFRSRWVFDVEILARYLTLRVEDAGPPRRSRIYELTVPAWHDVPGSKLRTWDFVRAMFELVTIWRDRRASPASPAARSRGQSDLEG